MIITLIIILANMINYLVIHDYDYDYDYDNDYDYDYDQLPCNT